jgi:hypothetical protein
MKKSALFLSILAIFILAGVAFWYYFSATNHSYQRNIANEKSPVITANDIVQQFKSNDTTTNQKYLNKVISVTGQVGNTEAGADGNITVTLKSNDSTGNVFCTLKSPAQKPAIGSTITIKGICTGLVLSDVVLNEAIIVK